jgi:hypothetical protein
MKPYYPTPETFHPPHRAGPFVIGVNTFFEKLKGSWTLPKYSIAGLNSIKVEMVLNDCSLEDLAEPFCESLSITGSSSCHRNAIAGVSIFALTVQ